MRVNETQFNNKNISFGGNNKSRFISDKYFDWMRNINGAHQRGIIGATAVVLQTPLDYFNPMADKKTREFSTVKTIVKIVVGTLVGVSVRALSIKYAKKLTSNPQKLIAKIKDNEIAEKLKKIMNNPEDKAIFQNSLGTILGVAASFFTNFAIDMPLAKFAIQETTQKLNLSEAKPKEGKK